MYLRTCGSFKSTNRKKIGSANGKSAKGKSAKGKSAKGHICGRSANLSN
jgi:hypothetical protein